MAMNNSSYYLARNAYVCLADNHYIFLDLRTDEYLCLRRDDSETVKGVLNGHHSLKQDYFNGERDDTHISATRTVVDALVQKGLLVENSAKGKKPVEPNIDTPSKSTAKAIAGRRPDIRLAHIWHFFVASMIATLNLRLYSIERTVRAVEKRKNARESTALPLNTEDIAELFKVFRALRPFYPRPYLCLFDSLALVHFLARYNMYPKWVYGVKLEPFGAHCWIQAEGLVVNDIVDNVRNYTPIMSI